METKRFEEDCYKVLVTIKVRNSLTVEVIADKYSNFETATKDAKYITETQGLKTRVVHEIKASYYYNEDEI